MIEVLSVASEVYPLVKTGGLADVTGALPAALAEHGVHVRTLIPGYGPVLNALKKGQEVAAFEDLFGGPARLLAGSASGLDIIVLDAPHLYVRGAGIYTDEKGEDWSDNWQRFATLSYAGARVADGLIKDYLPEIVHAHDWQAGLVPAYVAYNNKMKAKTVITVHNLAFQGHYSGEIFPELQLPDAAFSVEGVEYYGGVGFLKAGLQCADALTTVSPTYASEIRTEEFGMGLDGLLNARADDLCGIINGIDLNAWNPGTDKALESNFRVSSVKGRAKNKAALRKTFGLEKTDGPLFAIVSRLTWQKGIDMLAESVDQLVAMGGQLCVLGSGEAEYEDALEAAAARHPGQVGMVLGYDEGLSHLMQGGADAILVPSRFEPCGLTQLIGLRYGCVPVVAHTGGLADTIIDANDAAIAAGVATGVVFSPITQMALVDALRRTIVLYRDPKAWSRVQRRGMKADVSWDASAAKYVDLYGKLLGRKLTNDS